MKRITSIFAMLLIVFAVTFSACSAYTIVSAIDQLNKECPVDMGNGISMTSAAIDNNGDAVITITAPSVPVDALTSDDVVSNMKKSIESDDDLIKLMKDSNTKLIFHMVGSDGTADVSFEAADL